MSIKINFEIVSVNQGFGTAAVKFWADGATVDRFHADIGPYNVPISPDCATMTNDQLYAYIAEFGRPIVQRQAEVLMADQVGAIEKCNVLVGQTISCNLQDPTP